MRPDHVESVKVQMLASGAIVGSVAFVADWAVLGLVRERYSPTADAISRLAELGASTRPAMTGGFVVYGLGLLSYGGALRRVEPGWSWTWAVATGLATLGVAAFPLGRPTSGNVHAVFAVLGYAGLTGLQLAGCRRRSGRGERRAAALSLTTGLLTGGFLLASVATGSAHGLTQRIGLTAGDTWIVLTALALLRQHRRPRAGRATRPLP